jgi:DNA polymerase I-like protein with 3'-5' exonuclease and polymerase domains
MILRAAFPRHKTVMLINDFPVKKEIQEGEKFTAVSNLNLLTSLRTGRINNFTKIPVADSYKGILSTDIFTTYLDYQGFDEGNFDYRLELCKHADKIEGETYYQLENQKDVWVTGRLWKEFQLLLTEINAVKPEFILVTGKWSLFFLTGCSSLVTNQGDYKDKKLLGGLHKFRSSVLEPSPCFGLNYLEDDLAPILVPIWHTVNAMSMPDKLSMMELDIQKVAYMYHIIKSEGANYYKKPDKNYILGTSLTVIDDYFTPLLKKLKEEKVKVSIDIETFYYSIIDCIGFAYSIDEGICIPFAHKGKDHYWCLEDEVYIMSLLHKVLTHRNLVHVGQNYSYDCQYFFKLWGIHVEASWDTMLMHHVLYNYLPKDLAFLASLYCEHYTYWKDDIKASEESPETRWIYNAKDCCYTLEIQEVLEDILTNSGPKLLSFYKFQQDEVATLLVEMMNRGVRIDKEKKESLYLTFSKLMTDIVIKINNLLGYPCTEEMVHNKTFTFNINSHPQKKLLFSNLLGIKLKIKKGKGTETCDSAAMLEYIKEYPLYKPLLTLMLEYASIKVFVTNFLGMKLDDDDRARTQYKLASVATYRLASTKNVWGGGGNFQNIPEKGKIDLRYATVVHEESVYAEQNINEELDDTLLDFIEEPIRGTIELPNCKEIFLPDIGKEICDVDYSGADAMVVAWDSECKWLIDFFGSDKGKLYAYIASEHLQREITSKSPEYKSYKAVCHGCVTGDHEVLTEFGWVRIDEYDEREPLAVWDSNDSTIFFEVPRSLNRDFVDKEEDLYMIQGDSFSFLGTQNHGFPYKKSNGSIVRGEASTLIKSARIPYNGTYLGGDTDYPDDYMRLIAALQADGHIAYTDKGNISSYVWHFRKERKVTRLKSILNNLNIPYTYAIHNDGIDHRITIKGELEDYMKYPGSWLLEHTASNLKVWLLELLEWDGHVKTTNGVRSSISTTIKESAEWIQTIAHLCGYASKILTKHRDVTRKTIYDVSINNRSFYRVENGSRGLVKHIGTKVYCPQTSTGYFMVRRNNNIYVSGNTNYGLGIDKLATMLGISYHEAYALQSFYLTLCPEIKKWHERIQLQVAKQGYINNIFGARGWFLNRNDVNLLNKAYAWIPQSTIGILVNKGLVNIRRNYKDIDVLMQVHDSGVVQYDTRIAEQCRADVREAMTIELPYPRPLTMPCDIKVSTVSYGNTSKPKELAREFGLEEKKLLLNLN